MKIRSALLSIITVVFLVVPAYTQSVCNPGMIMNRVNIISDEQVSVITTFIEAEANSDINKLKTVLPSEGDWKSEQIIMKSNTGYSDIAKKLYPDFKNRVAISTVIQYKGTFGWPVWIEGNMVLAFDNACSAANEYAIVLLKPKNDEKSGWKKLPHEFSEKGIIILLVKAKGKWKVDTVSSNAVLTSYSVEQSKQAFENVAMKIGIIQKDLKNPDMNKWYPSIPGIDNPYADNHPTKENSKQP